MKKFISLLSVGAILFCSTVSLFSCTTECAHEHLTSKVIQPTCATEGYTLNTCTECKAEFKTNYVLPKGHALTSTVFEPTCREEGYTYYSCPCGFNYTAYPLPPTGHSYTSVTVPHSCESEGYTEYTCGTCSHVYRGGIISAPGHQTSYTIYPPTQTAMGYTEHVCSECDFSYRTDFEFFSEVFGGAPVVGDQVLQQGIDVSKHQHAQNSSGEFLPLDWKAIKAAGIDFVILRAGYMDTGNVWKIDPTFEMNYTGAKAAGLAVGVYLYSYAENETELNAEIEQLLLCIDGKQFEYPIYFDIEDKSIADDAKKEVLTSLCIKFVDTMRENGYYGAVYTNQKWLTEYLYGSSLRYYCDIWYARYPHSNQVSPDDIFEWNYESYGELFPVWQYTQSGIIPNCGMIKGQTVDLNYCYKDYPTIIKKYGLNGFENENLVSDTEVQE